VDEFVSKSQKKREAKSLKELGVSLQKLPAATLASLPLPQDLLDALAQIKSLRSHGAVRRQEQLIGKLMRKIDEETLQMVIARLPKA
jgi:ribosome-associated protein